MTVSVLWTADWWLLGPHHRLPARRMGTTGSCMAASILRTEQKVASCVVWLHFSGMDCSPASVCHIAHAWLRHGCTAAMRVGWTMENRQCQMLLAPPFLARELWLGCFILWREPPSTGCRGGGENRSSCWVARGATCELVDASRQLSARPARSLPKFGSGRWTGGSGCHP